MSSVEIGKMYENYIKCILSTKYNGIWLTKDVPPNIVEKCDLPLVGNSFSYDIGFDIVAIKNCKITFIQCKNYSKTIYQHDLSGFYSFIVNNYTSEHNYVLYYNGVLSSNIKSYKSSKLQLNIKYINVSFDNGISNNINNFKFLPHCYQIKAYEKLKGKKTSMLSLPCGMGKTFIAHLLSLDYDNIIILSPLKQHAYQNLEAFKGYYGNNKIKYNVVLSDFKKNSYNLGKYNVISVTYDSCHIVNELDIWKKSFVIVDECHNLSTSNCKPNSDIGRILHGTSNVLFMSATPKSLTTFFPSITLYEYKWDTAIKNGYLSDYKIYFPHNDILSRKYDLQLKCALNIKNDDVLDMYWKAYNIFAKNE